MNKVFFKNLLVALGVLFIVACENPVEAAPEGKWYDSWLNHSTSSLREEFHSEVKVAAGGRVECVVESDVPVIVGYYVQHGYEVTKDEGSIYMGTLDKPRMVGASSGTWKKFVPQDGVVKILFENASGVETSLAVYTAIPKVEGK